MAESNSNPYLGQKILYLDGSVIKGISNPTKMHLEGENQFIWIYLTNIWSQGDLTVEPSLSLLSCLIQ